MNFLDKNFLKIVLLKKNFLNHIFVFITQLVIVASPSTHNDAFLIVIYHSSLVKGAMNAARVCKLRNGVKKTPKFLLFSMAKVNQVRNEYSPQLSKLMA